MPIRPDTTRLISLDPDFRPAAGGHALGIIGQVEHSFTERAKELGFQYAVFGSWSAPTFRDSPVRHVPTFTEGSQPSDRPAEFPKLWREASRYSTAVLRSLERLDGDLRIPVRTIFYTYHGHVAYIPGAIKVGLALRGRCPIVISLYNLHANYGPGRPRQVPRLREFLADTKKLRARAGVHLVVDSERLADALFDDTGERVGVLPMFSLLPPELGPTEPTRGAPRRIVFPTACPDFAKGYDLVVKLAERLDRENVEIVTRAPGLNATQVCLPSLRARQGGLKVYGGFLSGESYADLVGRSDLVLVPYRHWRYLSRTSGALADAVHLGKPLVGTADSWIGDQIGKLGGRTFPDGDADGLVAAVREVLDNLDSYRESALRRRTEWLAANSAREFLRAIAAVGEKGGTLTSGLTGRVVADLSQVQLDAVIHGKDEVRELATKVATRVRSRLPPLSRTWGRFGVLADEGPVERIGAEPTRQQARGLVDRLPKEKDCLDRLPSVGWSCRGVRQVELRLDAPDGFLLARDGPRGELWGCYWASGSWIYLQDVTDGRPLTPGNTLDRVRFLRPNAPAPDSGGRGRARRIVHGMAASALQALKARTPVGFEIEVERTGPTPPVAELRWEAPGVQRVEIRIDAPDGDLFAAGSASGSVRTGEWIRPELVFYLLDCTVTDSSPASRVLATVSAADEQPYLPVTGVGRWLARSAIRIRGANGRRGLAPRAKEEAPSIVRAVEASTAIDFEIELEGKGMLRTAEVCWNAPGVPQVEIRLKSPDGDLFATGASSGSARTGEWVHRGMSFFLLDASKPDTPPLSRVLATASWDGLQGASTRTKDRRLAESPEGLEKKNGGDPSDSNGRDDSDRLPAETLSREARLFAEIERSLDSEEWGIIGPPTSGEFYALCAYSESFLRRFGGKRIALFASAPFIEICRLFPHAPIRGRDVSEFPGIQEGRLRQWGRVIRLHYGLAELPFPNHCGFPEEPIGFTRALLREVGIDVGKPDVRPQVSQELRRRAEEYFAEQELVPGRTVVLAPYCNSVAGIPMATWIQIARTLSERGFCVVTNTGPGERPLTGTRPLSTPLPEAFAAVELAGRLITARSGLLDVCSEAKVPIHALVREQHNLALAGVMLDLKLRANGLTDNVVHHGLRFGDSSSELADRLLAHPDFARRG